MALVDLKHLYAGRTINISFSQRRLLEAISRDPTAHLYSREYMARHGLTKGGLSSGLRTLKKRVLVGQEEDGWRVQPPEMKKWLEVLHEHGPAPAEAFRWATIDEHSTFFEQVHKASEADLRQEEQAALNNARRRMK